jgi:CPA2 family monovalent cation:H+ antiporter-2
MQRVGLDFVVIEINQRMVEQSKTAGVPTIFGDASSTVVLEAAGIHKARLLLVTVPDPLSVQLITHRVRAINPTLHIVARAAGNEQLRDLKRLGVHEVVQPELEAGLEMVRQVLVHYQIAPTDIQRFSDAVHQELYAPLYGHGDSENSIDVGPHNAQLLSQLRHASRTLTIEWVRLLSDSPLVDKTLSECAVRQRTGASIVAVLRESMTTTNPSSEYRFMADDVLAVLGTSEQVQAFHALAMPDGMHMGHEPQMSS